MFICNVIIVDTLSWVHNGLPSVKKILILNEHITNNFMIIFQVGDNRKGTVQIWYEMLAM